MNSLNHLLVKNRSWATAQQWRDPNFFPRLAHAQQPKILWIGCSDSRVPVETIVRAQPGELFVHRNIANVIEEKDDNLMSVVQYALEYLGVSSIVVCGHYGCGGIHSALNHHPMPTEKDPLSRSLSSLRRSLPQHLTPLDTVKTAGVEHLKMAVRANVQNQLNTLSNTLLVRRIWEQNKALTLFGCVYDLHTGFLDVIAQRNTPVKRYEK
ncbi:carbonic anhydrase [Serratia quinivorans]|uniref:carbonic anhydrase n=1 Tax=Serratia quinivorans TaxID=137545 RepID=UPI0034C616B6